jgi:hypothetical protein
MHPNKCNFIYFNLYNKLLLARSRARWSIILLVVLFFLRGGVVWGGVGWVSLLKMSSSSFPGGEKKKTSKKKKQEQEARSDYTLIQIFCDCSGLKASG